jgi:hypothetical protein
VPLFGEKRGSAEHQDWYAAAQPMIEWANSLPRVDLAVELMGLFGTVETCVVREIYARLFGVPMEVPVWRGDLRVAEVIERVEIPVQEALQLLEHAELVCGYHRDGMSIWVWRATRLGLATMATGRHTVRQRIKERTGL